MKLHFIVGTGRCGSSLVHEILARHEDVGFISNLDDRLPALGFDGRWNNRLYSATPQSWTRKGRLRFAPSEAYRLISREVSPVYANSYRDLEARDVSPWLRTRFEKLFARYDAAQHKPVFLHKYTGWPRMGFFAEIFPAARFLHVVRDGRAVANSWLQMDWWGGHQGPDKWQWGPLDEASAAEWDDSGRSFVTLAAICWKNLMRSYADAAAKLGPGRYLEVRYEDFLTDPETSLRAMAEFVELPWTETIARALRDQHLSPARSRAFERDLTPAQCAELEKSLGPTLARYGYAT